MRLLFELVTCSLFLLTLVLLSDLLFLDLDLMLAPEEASFLDFVLVVGLGPEVILIF